jgi:hypothetical protein
LKLERGEVAIVTAQFVALIVVVLFLSSFSPGQSAQSTPAFGSVYWGTSQQGTPLSEAHTTVVKQNASALTAYFTVAFSTQISAVAGSRLCLANATSGVLTTYTTIPFTLTSRGTGSIPLSPVGQPTGWVCTYTIKITDSLSQTVTWLGSVQVKP